MGLRMKNFNIMGFTQKSNFQGGRELQKLNKQGDCLKRGAWTVCRFKRGLDKNERSGIFDGGLTRQFTLCKFRNQKYVFVNHTM